MLGQETGPSFMFKEFNSYANKVSWLPYMSTDYEDYSVVHVPLIYSSRYEFQHQLYVNGFLIFIDNLTNMDPSRVSIRDKTCIVFDNEFYPDLVKDIFGNVSENSFDQRVLETENIQSSLIEKIVSAEVKYLSIGKLSREEILELSLASSKAISINFLNSVYEFLFMRLSSDESSLTKFEIPNIGFSYIDLYLKALSELGESPDKNNQKIFMWNYGFLKSTEKHISNQLDYREYQIEVNEKHILVPKINEPSSQLGDSPFIEAFKTLAFHEEWRHYWQARVSRLFRLLSASCKEPSYCDFEEVARDVE